MQAGVVKTKMCRPGLRLHRLPVRQGPAAPGGAKPEAVGIRVGSSRPSRTYRILGRQAQGPCPPIGVPACIISSVRIGFRACINDYLCSNCEFDQYFQDQYAVHAVLKPVDMEDVQGIQIPQGVYLHRGHAWVGMASGGQVRIGLDAFAARLLGPLDRIDLPLLGKPLKRGRMGICMNRGILNTGLVGTGQRCGHRI